MTSFNSSPLPPTADQLAQRVAALQAKAQATALEGLAKDAAAQDFKQIAAEVGAPAAGAATDRAAAELAQALAAQRRPTDGQLGVCQACGKPVNLGPFNGPSDRVLCASCQAGTAR